jgi:amidase
VPFTLKDCFSTAGLRTTAGFPPLADYVPQEDSTVAARLKAAGGVLVGKTNVPTLLADSQSANPLFGRTNNPWNVARTPGGSSGGPAAALAAGMTQFEIGTDLAASIRLPAHFCGVFGFKPTERRVSGAGQVPDLPGTPRSLRLMASIGPLARTAEDLALLFQVIAGPDGHDTEVPPVPVVPVDDVPPPALEDLRIAVAPNFPGFPVAAEVRGAVEALARQLEPLCAAVEAATLPELDLTQDLMSAGALIGMVIGAFQPNEHESPATLAQYLEVLHRRDQSIVAWERFFQQWDVLLCPPAMVAAFPHCPPESPLRVDGQEVEYGLVRAHGTLFNYTGHPAVVLPYTLDRDGLPIGVQLAGKRWADSRLLAIAESLSAVTGAFRRPPGY